MPAPDPPDGDPGLARARTRLAWTRTALAFGAVGLVILRRDVPAGVAILVMAPLIWVLGRLPAHPVTPRQRSRRLLLVSTTVVLISLVAAAVALLGPGPASLSQVFRWPR